MLTDSEYFSKRMTKLHTERGMPNVMTMEGIGRTLKPEHQWPQGDAWGQHDFTQEGAQKGASFNEILDRTFGFPDNVSEYASLAQWLNYSGYRAMYESNNCDRQGLLIWMSHACWPSFSWQCYDYYFEPTAAFFACKKACEPLHIQWNALTRRIEIVNRCTGVHEGLKASCEILDISGKVISAWSKVIDRLEDDTTLELDEIPQPDVDGVYFLRLSLADTDSTCLSGNFYVLSTKGEDLKDLRELDECTLEKTVSMISNDVNLFEEGAMGTCSMEVRLSVPEDSAPAMMVRLNLVGADGEQILPVDYSDNYFHLMPGDSKTVTIRWNTADSRGVSPAVKVSALNCKEK